MDGPELFAGFQRANISQDVRSYRRGSPRIWLHIQNMNCASKVTAFCFVSLYVVAAVSWCVNTLLYSRTNLPKVNGFQLIPKLATAVAVLSFKAPLSGS